MCRRGGTDSFWMSACGTRAGRFPARRFTSHSADTQKVHRNSMQHIGMPANPRAAIADVAHELRSSTEAIQMYATMARSAGSSDQVQRVLKWLEDEALHAAEIADSLLLLSRDISG
ncbi:histidine kinase dimerization/phospho-acceptor domain-containing protein [Streptomyces sp. NPDC127106]|uniref:histidine kinase dimerization/phospho-acceptor domain-containing protein n=1 Tax=Streptomyces sp. NPDC127106 TaxID=3345360 RepID=UPI003640408B